MDAERWNVRGGPFDAQTSFLTRWFRHPVCMHGILALYPWAIWGRGADDRLFHANEAEPDCRCEYCDALCPEAFNAPWDCVAFSHPGDGPYDDNGRPWPGRWA